LAHAPVLERVLALDARIQKLVAFLIHADEHDPVLNALQHFDVRIVFQSRHVLGRRIVDEIDFSGDQRRDPGRIGDDGQVDHLVGVAFESAFLDAPPVRVLGEHRLDVRLARLEHVRAGAVGLVRGDHVLFLGVVLRLGRAILFAPRAAHDVDGVDVLELDRIRAVGREIDRQRVDLLGNARCIGVHAELRAVGAGALEREHDVVGGKRRAVVKLDARAQVEAPRRRVELLPRVGERR